MASRATPRFGITSSVHPGFVPGLFLLLFLGPAWAAESVALQPHWLHQFQFAGYYAALEKDYYAREGLNVEIREATHMLFTSQAELRAHPERVVAFRRAPLLFESAAIRALMQPDQIETGHMDPTRWRRIEATHARLGMGQRGRDLDAFFYQPDKADWRWLIWPAGILALSTLVAVLVAFGLIRFNHKLKREMADKEIAREALNETNRVFINVLENVDVALYVIDAASLTILFSNGSARAQFGDMLGQSCYRTLLQRPARCVGCVPEAQTPLGETSRAAPPCAVNEFDFHHDASGRWYHAAHRVVRWMDGRAVLVGAAVDITSRKQREEEQAWLASHDTLTKLPNRDLLADRLKTTLALAHRAQSLVAVLFLDLDGFKPVNDRLGHEAGDELLSRLARRLESRLRESDTLARVGGDEFVMVIPIARYEELGDIVLRLADDLRKPFDLGQGEARVDGSIGIAVYPNDADTPDALLRLADEAMYLVKQSGRGGYALREDPDSELKITRWVR